MSRTSGITGKTQSKIDIKLQNRPLGSAVGFVVCVPRVDRRNKHEKIQDRSIAYHYDHSRNCWAVYWSCYELGAEWRDTVFNDCGNFMHNLYDR